MRCWCWNVVDIIGSFNWVVKLGIVYLGSNWSFLWRFQIFTGEERSNWWFILARSSLMVDSSDLWTFFVLFLRGKNLVNRCCLSCLIFWRANILTFFAIAIHFANELVFSSKNSNISSVNHLNCSWGCL